MSSSASYSLRKKPQQQQGSSSNKKRRIESSGAAPHPSKSFKKKEAPLNNEGYCSSCNNRCLISKVQNADSKNFGKFYYKCEQCEMGFRGWVEDPHPRERPEEEDYDQSTQPLDNDNEDDDSTDMNRLHKSMVLLSEGMKSMLENIRTSLQKYDDLLAEKRTQTTSLQQ